MSAATLAIVGSIATVIGVGFLLWSTIQSGRETRTEFADAKRDRTAIRSELQGGLGAVRSDLQDGLGAVRSDLGGEIRAVRSDLGDEIRAVRSEVQNGFAAILRRLPAESDDAGPAASGAQQPSAPLQLAAKSPDRD